MLAAAFGEYLWLSSCASNWAEPIDKENTNLVGAHDRLPNTTPCLKLGLTSSRRRHLDAWVAQHTKFLGIDIVAVVAVVEIDLIKVEGGGITKLVIIAARDQVKVELVVNRNLLEGTS